LSAVPEGYPLRMGLEDRFPKELQALWIVRRGGPREGSRVSLKDSFLAGEQLDVQPLVGRSFLGFLKTGLFPKNGLFHDFASRFLELQSRRMGEDELNLIRVFSLLFEDLPMPIATRFAMIGLSAMLTISLHGGLAWAQIVQLPSSSMFSLSTSAAVPDRGSVGAGGMATGQLGSLSRGPGIPNVAQGGNGGASSFDVRTTVIDLDELDRMIRSQATDNPEKPRLQQNDPRGFSRISASAKRSVTRPDYDYLATLSGHGTGSPTISGNGVSKQATRLNRRDYDAIKSYLELAHAAKQRGHWASVETYYKLAWETLPESRRKSVLQDLEEARTSFLRDQKLPSGSSKVTPESR